MAKLVIVESPAKAKTIGKYLGDDYEVTASMGHIRDLPASQLGIDVEHGYTPQYISIKGKEKLIKELKSKAKHADGVLLATDPDREGEAISWHLANILGLDPHEPNRVTFDEITKKGVKEGMAHPRAIDEDLFNAQQARRVLDRLVGYKLSPFLWRKVRRGLSAGRVQSVAVRLIDDREKEIENFKPDEYWNVDATLGAGHKSFVARLATDANGKKLLPKSEAEARAIEKGLEGASYVVSELKRGKRAKQPTPAFITSTLQQEASRRLGFTATRTMRAAQTLYEGVDIAGHGMMGLITYMRTDSLRISDEAVAAAKEYIAGAYGEAYICPYKRTWKTKSATAAQDAHEAIRPVDVTLTPEDVKPYLAPDQYQVYRLIWARFVASQMAAARFHDTTVTIDNGPVQWRSKGERMLFPGFLAVMPRGKDEEGVELPALTKGETLKLNSLTKEQKFTQPSPRFTEASLVRELEELGIGRPSTYASIISTLQDRDYVTLEEKHFAPTDLGRVVCDRLREHFKTLMDVGFTAHMEELLDKVAEGQQDWVALLRNFNNDFDPTLLEAAKSMGKAKTDTVTDIPGPECGKPLAVKFGKTGQFLACTGYPACRYTSNYTRDEQGQIHLQEKVKPEFEKVGTCPECGKDLVLKRSRTGSRFIACSGYPDCKHAEPYSTGVPCPREGCNGVLVEKSSKRGKIFYSCSNYPQCDYALWDWPIAEPCPECGSPLLVLKNTKAKGKFIACPEKTCKYTRPLEGGSEDDAE